MRYNLEEDGRKELAGLLLANHMSVSAAESCTGGLIGKLITDMPGSSAYLRAVR